MARSTLRNMLVMLLTCFTTSSCEGDEKLLSDPQKEKDATKEVIKFAEKYAKVRPMTLISSGNFFHLDPPASFGLWMADFSPVSLENGRLIAVKFVSEFWEEIQRNPAMVRYFKYNLEMYPRFYSGDLGLKDVCVRIAFWDSDTNRPLPPKIAEISFYKGVFYYYETDAKTQGLKLVLEESYDEAIKKNNL